MLGSFLKLCTLRNSTIIADLSIIVYQLLVENCDNDFKADFIESKTDPEEKAKLYAVCYACAWQFRHDESKLSDEILPYTEMIAEGMLTNEAIGVSFLQKKNVKQYTTNISFIFIFSYRTNLINSTDSSLN